MSKVLVRGISKSFGEIDALSNVSLEIKEGSFTVLLGPSGSGKSTLLNLLAGFDNPDRGDIYLDGLNVVGVAPNKRDISMVFQKHSLYPDKTVRKNLSFSLDIRPISSVEFQNENTTVDASKASIINKRVSEIAQLLSITELLDRMPHQLSGGQIQRVAIGKALIRKSSKLLLMDEPFSNLDPMLRVQLRKELKSIVKERQLTVVFVTHDQTEAEDLADEILILRNGRLLQVGNSQSLYNRPENLFVASFFGVPALNIVQCYTNDDFTKVVFEPSDDHNKRVKIGVRPNAIKFSAMNDAHVEFPFVYKSEKFLNGHFLVEGQVGSDIIHIVDQHSANHYDRTERFVYVKNSDLLVFDWESGDNLR